jgi:hypothetical protein
MKRQARKLTILAVFIAAAVTFAGCKKADLTVTNVTKQYKAVQATYDAARQAARQAYLDGLLRESVYKEFVEEVDHRAVRIDNMIVAALDEAKGLQGAQRENKLLYAVRLIQSFRNLVVKAQQYKIISDK